MIKARLVNNINIESLIKQINPLIDNASAVVFEEIKKYATPFTPRVSGSLLDSMYEIKNGNRYVGIGYNVDYAHHVYYGLESWNWTVAVHPNASPRWLHRAFDIYKKNIMGLVNKNIKGGI